MKPTLSTHPPRFERDRIDSPAVVAARLAGQRRAYVELLVDADLSADVQPDRSGVMVTPSGVLDWTTTPLPGSVSAYGRAEAHLGGVA